VNLDSNEWSIPCCSLILTKTYSTTQKAYTYRYSLISDSFEHEKHNTNTDMLANKDFFHSSGGRRGVSIHKSRGHLLPVAGVNRDNIIL
jgi:hypothetical protein